MTESPIKILVVDDQDASRFVKTQILRRAGYAVTDVATGRDALDRVASARPDLVVLDVNLPDVSGLEICRRIKSDTTIPTIQVLQVSQTAVTEHDRAQGLDHGADMYLAEPFGSEVLLATVRALLRVREAERELARALHNEREARDEAQRANGLKDAFLAMVSHELRTPLNAMSGWIWQLKRGALDENTYQRAVEVLDRNVRIQVQLINDLLDISRIATGKLKISTAPVDLEPIAAAAAEVALDSPSHRRKEITLDVRTSPATVLGDAARLQQVVTNLLNNAFQFTPRGGHITLTCGVRHGKAFIEIADSGIGIAPEFLPHVFEQFRQERALEGRREPGLGLGLAIVQDLVHQHQGTVTITSEGIGRGTTCTILLPLVEPARATATARASAPPARLTALNVLLVEDDPDARDVLHAILTERGATVLAVDNVTTAEVHAATGQFDVLVTDIGLPDGSGSDLVRRLRARGHSVPAIAVTAFATDPDRRRLLDEGFDEHVAKPVDPEALVNAVGRVANPIGR